MIGTLITLLAIGYFINRCLDDGSAKAMCKI